MVANMDMCIGTTLTLVTAPIWIGTESRGFSAGSTSTIALVSLPTSRPRTRTILEIVIFVGNFYMFGAALQASLHSL